VKQPPKRLYAIVVLSVAPHFQEVLHFFFNFLQPSLDWRELAFCGVFTLFLLQFLCNLARVFDDLNRVFPRRRVQNSSEDNKALALAALLIS